MKVLCWFGAVLFGIISILMILGFGISIFTGASGFDVVDWIISIVATIAFVLATVFCFKKATD